MKTVIIGGGISGLSTALDLSLRGVECTLVEKDKLGSGTTTKCAGMLHSGARYLVSDLQVATYLFQECKIIKHIAPFTIINKKGLFVLLKGEKADYPSKFEEAAGAVGMKLDKLTRGECLILEPSLGADVIGGYLVPDATIDPFLLVDAYREELTNRGVTIIEGYKLVKGIYSKNKHWVLNFKGKEQTEDVSVVGDSIINASGDGISEVISCLGARINVKYIHGSMLVLGEKVSSRVVSICAPNKAGDVIIPSGKVSIVGSTWQELTHNKPIYMSEKDREIVLTTSSGVIPRIREIPIRHTFTGIRVHPVNSHKWTDRKDFNITRGFQIINHERLEGLPNVFTIFPGKLTFGRLVAEKVGDLLMRKYCLKKPSETKDFILRVPRKISGLTLDTNI